MLIAVEAASITFAELGWTETWSRDGVSRLPVIPSHEFCGSVVAVGSSVSEWKIGDRVFGLIPFDLDGAAAEFVVVAAGLLSAAPTTATAVEAAATPLAALTAWQALFDHAKLTAGQKVLIHGGAGGVGIFAVQLARHGGAEVSVTARAADSDFLTSLGADHIIDFETTRFDETDVRFDVVLDPIGGETLDRSMSILRPGGIVVTLNAPPSQERASELGVRALFFIVEPNPQELAEIASLIDDGGLRVAVSATFELSEGRKAFESGASHGRAPGKTVLSIVPPR